VCILWARNFYIKKKTQKHTTLIEKHGRFGGGAIPPTFFLSFLPRKKKEISPYFKWERNQIPPTFKSSSPHISKEVCVLMYCLT
jgi:hypothetical protein